MVLEASILCMSMDVIGRNDHANGDNRMSPSKAALVIRLSPSPIQISRFNSGRDHYGATLTRPAPKIETISGEYIEVAWIGGKSNVPTVVARIE